MRINSTNVIELFESYLEEVYFEGAADMLRENDPIKYRKELAQFKKLYA